MIFSMIFWGASWVNVKILTSYINEYEVIFLRMSLSILAMYPILYYLKLNLKIDLKSFFLIILASFVLVLYSIMFFYGVKHGTAGLGGALVTTLIPINTFVLLAFWHKKVISLKNSFALILGAFGVLTMLDIWQFDLKEIFSIENIFFLSASFLWPLLTIISSKATNTSPLVFNFYINLFTTIVIYLLFIDFNIIERSFTFDYKFWLNLLSLSILATAIATSIYFIGIERLGTKAVSSFIFLVPSSALVLSAIFLDEKITFNTLLGTICALIAIYILNDLNFNFLKRKQN